jgi:hypothetical protein
MDSCYLWSIGQARDCINRVEDRMHLTVAEARQTKLYDTKGLPTNLIVIHTGKDIGIGHS